MALQSWPDRYWQRLLEDEDYETDPQGKKVLMPTFQKALELIKTKDVSIIDYDIGIRAGSSLPANRMARLDMALELAKEPVHPDAVYDREAVLTYLDDPQADMVLKRHNDRQQMRQQLQQMGQGMEQMGKQMDQIQQVLSQKEEELDKIKLQHVEDMGKMKWRYETTIEKMNLKLAAEKDKKRAVSQKK